MLCPGAVLMLVLSMQAVFDFRMILSSGINQIADELKRFVQVNPVHVKYQMIEVGVVIVCFAQFFVEIMAALVFVFDNLGCAAL